MTEPQKAAQMATLSTAYDVAVLDLDGVVYVGAHAVDGAAEALVAAKVAGMHLAFVTNNAARPPEDVAKHLVEIGLPVTPEDVVTSAQAAARLVAAQVPPRSRIYVIGGRGLEEALRERDLLPVTSPEDDPIAVVQGYGPDVPWRQVLDGAILVKQGLPWVASNLDLTVPTERGPGPGNGALVDLVARFAQREPEVAGKPEPPLFEETLARVGGTRPLVIGDRLDTDIDGAHHVGWDSLLVMTGVTTLTELALLEKDRRPTYVGADLSCLAEPGENAELDGSIARLGGWTATVADGRLSVTGEGDRHSWWRAAATALWAHLDATGSGAETAGNFPPR